jgi:kynurenine formamidase
VRIPELNSAEDEQMALRYVEELSNRGRWGPEDSSGTLNALSADRVVEASALIRTGVHVSCARPIGLIHGAAPGRSVLHWMGRSGADNPPTGSGTATDWVGIPLHGTEYTHIDGHAHCFWNGLMYNGRSMLSVTTESGATEGGLEPVFHGAVGRGVLIDAVAVNGGKPLPAGVAVESADIDRFLRQVDIKLRPGDLLFVRTGNRSTHERDGLPGLDLSCLPVLHDNLVSILTTDAVSDVFPGRYASMSEPIHTICIASMGMWIIDNAALDNLADQCSRNSRYEFFAVVSPIPFRRATGSLVNPVAIF